MSENTVRFGLKNVYYATCTVSGSTVTHGTPVAIPGGVNLTMNAVGETTKFYADNMLYFQCDNRQGYDGTLEFARIPDDMLTDVFGLTEGSTSKVLTEKNTNQTVAIDLLFQIDGDENNELHVLYNVKCSLPTVASGTIQATKSPVTQSVSFSSQPLPDGKIRAKTTDSTATTVRSAWFTTVFVES